MLHTVDEMAEAAGNAVALAPPSLSTHFMVLRRFDTCERIICELTVEIIAHDEVKHLSTIQ